MSWLSSSRGINAPQWCWAIMRDVKVPIHWIGWHPHTPRDPNAPGRVLRACFDHQNRTIHIHGPHGAIDTPTPEATWVMLHEAGHASQRPRGAGQTWHGDDFWAIVIPWYVKHGILEYATQHEYHKGKVAIAKHLGREIPKIRRRRFFSKHGTLSNVQMNA